MLVIGQHNRIVDGHTCETGQYASCALPVFIYFAKTTFAFFMKIYNQRIVSSLNFVIILIN